MFFFSRKHKSCKKTFAASNTYFNIMLPLITFEIQLDIYIIVNTYKVQVRN